MRSHGAGCLIAEQGPLQYLFEAELIRETGVTKGLEMQSGAQRFDRDAPSWPQIGDIQAFCSPYLQGKRGLGAVGIEDACHARIYIISAEVLRGFRISLLTLAKISAACISRYQSLAWQVLLPSAVGCLAALPFPFVQRTTTIQRSPS